MSNNFKKSLTLPGFSEETVVASARALRKQYGWTDQQLLWLQHNWILIKHHSTEGPIYAKPYSHFDYKKEFKNKPV